MRPINAIVPICLVLAMLASSPAGAQEARDSMQIFDLDFKGGAVNSYVRAIRGEADRANIIVMEHAGTVPVPPVELRSVTVSTAVRILDGLTHSNRGHLIHLAIEEHEPETRYVPDEPGRTAHPARRPREPIGTAVFSIHALIQKTAGFGPEVPDVSSVIAVSELLEEVSPEALLTAVQTALDILDEDLPPARIRFHEDTGLIIARGHPEQMKATAEVADQVIHIVRQRQRSRERAAKNTQLQSHVVELRDQLDEARSEGEALRREVARTRTTLEMLTRELDSTQAQLMVARQEKDEMAHMIRQLEMELARLRDEQNDRE